MVEAVGEEEAVVVEGEVVEEKEVVVVVEGEVVVEEEDLSMWDIRCW